MKEGKEYNWQDTWKDNTVQLAALGAITVGAGTMAINGNFNNALVGGSRGLKAMGKGLDNYMTRRAHPGSRFVYQVGKGTFKNLTRMPGGVKSGDQILGSRIKRSIEEMEKDPAIQTRIREETARRLSGAAGSRNKVNSVLDGKGLPKGNEEQRIREIYEEVRMEELQKELGMAPQQNNRRTRATDGGPRKPLFEKGELRRKMVVDGLSGIAFAGGITGVHALDRSLNSKGDTKAERTFELGGSFMNSKEERDMKKTAGQLEAYNRLKQIAGKSPDALASGIGYTGASLVAGGAMGGPAAAQSAGKKKQEEEEATHGPRVIIELGNEDPALMGNAMPGVGMSLPKQSSEESSVLEKKALRLPDFRSFGRDFKGHGPEIQALKDKDHSAEAAERLKDKDVNALVKERYGNLVNEQTLPTFTTKLYDAEAETVKQEAAKQILDLETRQAGARLKGGAAIGAGGLAGLAAMKSQKGEEQNA